MSEQTTKRKVKRSEYRFIYLYRDYGTSAKLHIVRYTANDNAVMGCNGEVFEQPWQYGEVYPLYRFMALNAPICRDCRRRAELELGQLI